MRIVQYLLLNLIVLFPACLGIHSTLLSCVRQKGLSCLNTEIENLIQPAFLDRTRHTILGTQETVKRIIDEGLKRFPELSVRINEFRAEMDQIVIGAKQFLENPRFADINMQDVVQKWGEGCGDIYNRLQKEFQEPLPEKMDEKMNQREKIIAALLNESQDLFIQTISDIRALSQEEEKGIRTQFSLVSGKLKKFILITCKMLDDHPTLVFLVSIISLWIPPGHFLHPLLLLFGFGPLGPVKGSVAAWSQKAFWGATVNKGSWFSILQTIAMG